MGAYYHLVAQILHSHSWSQKHRHFANANELESEGRVEGGEMRGREVRGEGGEGGK